MRALTLYDVYFAAIPGILERNVEEHWGLIFTNFAPKDKSKKYKIPNWHHSEEF
jgi:hypothetical protein